ncbi:MAG: protein phosphatase 2C domain-containing protein, partial [Chloroflexota bacterium]
NQLRSGPSRALKRVVPGRFRTATVGDADPDKELPPEEIERRGGRRRATRGRRVRIAQRIDFTQVHLISKTTHQRTILHIGSTIGTSETEVILNPKTKHAIRLKFSKMNDTNFGAPFAVTLVAAPRDTSLSVDNRSARPTVGFRNGSLMNVGGESYDVELNAGGSLPAITRVNAAWATNVGPRRDINQDAIGIYQHPRAYMFTVADGVGGGYAGEEVSEYAVKYLQSVFKKNIDFEKLSWYDIYQTAYRYINQEVRNWVQNTPQPAGTTLSSMFIRSWTAYIAHVGDSRIYLLRHGQLRQLTTDHNSEVEVETRNRAGYPVTVVKSVLQRAIGKSDGITADVSTLTLQPKDRIVMMTDGVSNNMEDQEIADILRSGAIAAV